MLCCCCLVSPSHRQPSFYPFYSIFWYLTNTVEQITSDTTSDPESPSASAGTSHNDETDNTSGNGLASRKKKKPLEIQEDTQVSSEFAKDLDLSCMIGRTLVRAPNIENGYIVKYNR